MTDQTRNPTAEAPKPSSQLSAEDQAQLAALTAPKSTRYSADAQNQRGLERLRDWTRALFKRADGRRWRDSKTKILGFIVAGAAAFAFWNYYPHPQLSGGVDTPGLTIGSSSSAPNGQAQADPSRSGYIASARTLDALEATAPPKLPAPSLEQGPNAARGTPTTATSVPLEDPYQGDTQLSDSVPVTPRAISIQEPVFPSTRLTNPPPNEFEFATPPLSRPRVAQLVAPAPVPLAQVNSVSQYQPKPLVDRTGSERATTEASALSDPTSRTNNALEVAATPASASEPMAVTAPRAEPNERDASPLVSPQEVASQPSSFGQAGVLFDRTATQAAASVSSTAPSSVQTAPSPYPPGSRLEGKLTVGVIVLSGRESPVVVALADGAVAFGKATLTETTRVQIALLEVVKDGQSVAVNGSALGGDGFSGVTGEVREDGPDAVAKLWNAALSGVSSYVQGLTKAGTTIIGNGVTTVTNGTPDLGWSLVGALAQAFLPQQNQQLQTIRYVVLPPGASLQILFMPSR